MNILEAYIKFFNGIVIYISGLSGCGKTELVNNISLDFKLKVIDQKIYYKDPVKKTLSNGETVDTYDDDQTIDWDKMNKDIEKAKTKGVIVNGVALLKDKLPPADYHLHVSVGKQKCLDVRRNYLTRHKDKYGLEFEKIGTETERLKMLEISYPYYLDSIKRSVINKFINANELTNNQIYDIAFEKLIDFIDHKVYKKPHETEKKHKRPKKLIKDEIKEEIKEETKEETKEEMKVV